ncbi:MAG: group 1 truncated hemoglobin [Acidobacteriota bacterium]
MNDNKNINRILAIFLLTVMATGVAAAGPEPSASEQINSLQTMCKATAQARTQRQATEPLYHRLGGYDRIHKLTTEIVRRHNQNPEIGHMFSPERSELLAKHVADFVATGTGGPATYTGRDMPVAHANMKLTEADFVSATEDIVDSMKALGHGRNEIDEIVCILISLKDQVLMK